MDSNTLWKAVLGELEVTLSGANFKTWFKDTGIISREGGRVVIAVPNPMAKNWLENKFNIEISNSFRHVGIQIEKIEYKISSLPRQSQLRDPLVTAVTAPRRHSAGPVAANVIGFGTAATAAPAMPRGVGRRIDNINNPVQTQARFPVVHHPQLNPRYTFDNFVVGSSNELAYAAAQAVVAYPGEKYNPLFLYGGVGLGKTHLMQAIGNEIIRRDPDMRVRYVTCEQLTNEFVASLQTKKTKRFADLYRSLDVLIVDDIQFLGNKEKTQEEFFHTFNALHQAGKQIIISSDKPPKAIPHLEDRLRSRFEWGMTADIQRPDLETRVAIIQRKAFAGGVRLPLDLVEYLARHIQHNIREAEGVLTQVSAYCEHHRVDPSMSVIKSVLGGQRTASTHSRAITPKIVLEKTANYFDLHVSDLTGPRRDKDIVMPRQIAMYIMRAELGLSFPKIGSSVGGRDHTTAMHSVEKIEKMIELDEELRSEINQVKERISL